MSPAGQGGGSRSQIAEWDAQRGQTKAKGFVPSTPFLCWGGLGPSSPAPGVRCHPSGRGERGIAPCCMNVGLGKRKRKKNQQPSAPGQMVALLGILLKFLFS